MRLFISLNVPSLAEHQKSFKKIKTNLLMRELEHRFVPIDLHYIPILELGDYSQGALPGLYQKLKRVLQDAESFSLKLTGIWGHPNQKEADMLWIGVQNSRNLQMLQSSIAEQFGVLEENYIRPHIPLVYLKKKKDITDVISPFKNSDFGKIVIANVSIQDKLSGDSGVHRVLSCNLRESGIGDDSLMTSL